MPQALYICDSGCFFVKLIEQNTLEASVFHFIEVAEQGLSQGAESCGKYTGIKALAVIFSKIKHLLALFMANLNVQVFGILIDNCVCLQAV